MTRDEHVAMLSRICVRGAKHPAHELTSKPFALGRWWSGATNGSAFVMVKRYLGLRSAPPDAYREIAGRYLKKRTPRRACGYREKQFRAWIRSTKHDEHTRAATGELVPTPVSISGVIVDRRLVARALSAVPSSDGNVWLWKDGPHPLDPLVVDGVCWRVVVMPMANVEPRARWGKPLPAEERAA